MPNHYFQFQQFKIEQQKSGMKVCTDSCLFGAWIADKIEKKVISPETILDIGTGTGLLSLMLAQKSDASIDAVEIDESAHHQSFENFLQSPWSQCLRAYHADIKTWQNHSPHELIVANPPFFENDLKAHHKNKNLAKHDDGLTFSELMHSVKNNLSEKGHFAILLPFHRVGYFKTVAAESRFYLQEEVLLKQTPRHTYFRGMLFYGSEPTQSLSKEIIIKDESGDYTPEFKILLKDYYLAFA